MPRTPSPVSAALAAGLLLTGCGSVLGGDPGAARTQDRPIPAVSAVELATGGDLTVTAGDTPALRITAGENVIDRLTSEVHGDRLVLDTDRSVGNLGTVRYDLVLPAARELAVSGSGSAVVSPPSALTRVELSGSGELRVDGLATEELTAELSGSGEVTVAGRATRQRVELDGSGEYHAQRLDTADAEVTVAGSGSADVQVSGHLDADVEGSGTIRYGGGATVQRQVDGSGSIEPR
jgi:hypothetical protein